MNHESWLFLDPSIIWGNDGLLNNGDLCESNWLFSCFLILVLSRKIHQMIYDSWKPWERQSTLDWSVWGPCCLPPSALGLVLSLHNKNSAGNNSVSQSWDCSANLPARDDSSQLITKGRIGKFVLLSYFVFVFSTDKNVRQPSLVYCKLRAPYKLVTALNHLSSGL